MVHGEEDLRDREHKLEEEKRKLIGNSTSDGKYSGFQTTVVVLPSSSVVPISINRLWMNNLPFFTPLQIV